MPQVERNRIRYALDSLQHAVRGFPWNAQAQTCILLIDPQVQWVVNCPSSPSGFQETQGTFAFYPIFWHMGDAIILGGHEVPTEALVKNVPATADIPLPNGTGTALGGPTPWVISSTLDALIEFHPAFEESSPTEEWLGVFVHELVHTLQLGQKSFRPALEQLKSGELSPAPLSELYDSDTAYRQLVDNEYDVLVAAATSQNESAARTALASWSVIYAKRRNLLQKQGGEQLVRADAAFTYIEGTARYVEALFLAHATHRAPGSIEGDSRFGNSMRTTHRNTRNCTEEAWARATSTLWECTWRYCLTGSLRIGKPPWTRSRNGSLAWPGDWLDREEPANSSS